MAFCMLLMFSGSVYRLGRCLLGYHGVRRQVWGGESWESTRRGPRACSWLYRDPRVCGRLLLLLNVIYLSLITLYSFFGRFQQRRFIFVISILISIPGPRGRYRVLPCGCSTAYTNGVDIKKKSRVEVCLPDSYDGV